MKNYVSKIFEKMENNKSEYIRIPCKMLYTSGLYLILTSPVSLGDKKLRKIAMEELHNDPFGKENYYRAD